MEESKESKDKSDFRSALLTRCQNTFEEKRMFEINSKKAEVEKEIDVGFSLFVLHSSLLHLNKFKALFILQTLWESSFQD